jgi:hypothetical protein
MMSDRNNIFIVVDILTKKKKKSSVENRVSLLWGIQKGHDSSL